MTEKESALHSQYIIDGIRYDITPAGLLDECLRDSQIIHPDAEGCTDIIDESIDPPVSTFTYDNNLNEAYLKMCMDASSAERSFRLLYPDTFTRQRIAYALIDRLWNEGHYRLGDLNLWAKWTWNTRPLGSMAAFYSSAEAVNSYLFDLGVKLRDYYFEESDEESNASFYAWLQERENDCDDDDMQLTFPYESHHPWISEERKCPGTISPSCDSWMIYIPFDTCAFSLGGSLLAQSQGRNGGIGPRISDPDYFIDCYEVVRELVEDGIVMAGVTVADGGLATAAAMMCDSCGIGMDINGLVSSYQEKDTTKMLFSEVPGVLLQISDSDYDYMDSQLILQDIAYYPVGHPTSDFTGIRFRNERKSGVAGILASLLEQATEGED